MSQTQETLIPQTNSQILSDLPSVGPFDAETQASVEIHEPFVEETQPSVEETQPSVETEEPSVEETQAFVGSPKPSVEVLSSSSDSEDEEPRKEPKTVKIGPLKKKQKTLPKSASYIDSSDSSSSSDSDSSSDSSSDSEDEEPRKRKTREGSPEVLAEDSEDSGSESDDEDEQGPAVLEDEKEDEASDGSDDSGIGQLNLSDLIDWLALPEDYQHDFLHYLFDTLSVDTGESLAILIGDKCDWRTTWPVLLREAPIRLSCVVMSHLCKALRKKTAKSAAKPKDSTLARWTIGTCTRHLFQDYQFGFIKNNRFTNKDYELITDFLHHKWFVHIVKATYHTVHDGEVHQPVYKIFVQNPSQAPHKDGSIPLKHVGNKATKAYVHSATGMYHEAKASRSVVFEGVKIKSVAALEAYKKEL